MTLFEILMFLTLILPEPYKEMNSYMGRRNPTKNKKQAPTFQRTHNKQLTKQTGERRAREGDRLQTHLQINLIAGIVQESCPNANSPWTTSFRTLHKVTVKNCNMREQQHIEMLPNEKTMEEFKEQDNNNSRLQLGFTSQMGFTLQNLLSDLRWKTQPR